MLFPEAGEFVLEKIDGVGESCDGGDATGEGNIASKDVVRSKSRRSRHEMSAKKTTGPRGMF
ncbi:hypothetical protein ACHAXS_002597 [Conticribra weissflogii]